MAGTTGTTGDDGYDRDAERADAGHLPAWSGRSDQAPGCGEAGHGELPFAQGAHGARPAGPARVGATAEDSGSKHFHATRCEEAFSLERRSSRDVDQHQPARTRKMAIVSAFRVPVVPAVSRHRGHLGCLHPADVWFAGTGTDFA
jgi:hypothetical protein